MPRILNKTSQKIHGLQARVTEKEYAYLVGQATELDMNMSDYIRFMLLKDSPAGEFIKWKQERGK